MVEEVSRHSLQQVVGAANAGGPRHARHIDPAGNLHPEAHAAAYVVAGRPDDSSTRCRNVDQSLGCQEAFGRFDGYSARRTRYRRRPEVEVEQRSPGSRGLGQLEAQARPRQPVPPEAGHNQEQDHVDQTCKHPAADEQSPVGLPAPVDSV